MKLEPKRILLIVWFTFSTVSTVISLASLADDIIAWTTFIRGLIASYREIVNFIWGHFFSLFRLELPQSVHDYLTINSLFAASVAWALFHSSEKLGFQQLGSFWQFLKNNVGSFSLGLLVLVELRRRRGSKPGEETRRVDADVESNY